MVLNCASTDWSAVTSATANTTLAGVLAGFMINGIVLLLSTTPAAGQRSGYVQGAGLLFTALVALGLDSYLFGLVTGDTAASACRRAWTEAMFAAGLLGLGAVALIVAIVFLLGVFFWDTSTTSKPIANGSEPAAGPQPKHAENADVDRKKALNDEKAMTQSKEMLATLCTWLRPGVAVVVILLLWVTARSYLSSIFNDNPPHWATSLLTSIFVVDNVVIATFVIVYLWVSSGTADESATGQAPSRESPGGSRMPGWLRSTLRVLGALLSKLPILNRLPRILNRFRNKLLDYQQYDFIRFRTPNGNFIRPRMLNGILNLTWKGLQPNQSGETKTLKVALFSALGYSLLSAFMVGWVVYGPATFWNSSGAWVNSVFVATVIWVLVVALVPLAALLAPTFGPRRAATRLDGA